MLGVLVAVLVVALAYVLVVAITGSGTLALIVALVALLAVAAQYSGHGFYR